MCVFASLTRTTGRTATIEANKRLPAAGCPVARPAAVGSGRLTGRRLQSRAPSAIYLDCRLMGRRVWAGRDCSSHVHQPAPWHQPTKGRGPAGATHESTRREGRTKGADSACLIATP